MEKLNEETSGKLRKTQIITKVSDIVRELVDNSIDAQSSSIQVILDNFGIDKIEVQDTGTGIKKSEFQFSVTGGYTSKLDDITHLSCKNQYGFRGEALNSICLISDLTISTRAENEEIGNRYFLDHRGEIKEQKTVAIKIGTTIKAIKVFENFPVRRQWIKEKKNCRDELNEIINYLKFVGIANHKIQIKLIHNGSVIWSKPSVPTLKQAIVAGFGIEIAKNLEECESKDERISHCFLPKKTGMDTKAISFSNQRMSMIFVNRKRVVIPQFIKLIQRFFTIVASKNPVNAPIKRFPFCVINIHVDWKDVDFNLEVDKSKALITCQDELLISLEEILEKYYEFNLNDVEKSISSFNESSIELLVPSEGQVEAIDSIPPSKSNESRENSIISFLSDLPAKSTSNFSSPLKQSGDFKKNAVTPLKEKEVEKVNGRLNDPLGFECDFNLGIDLFSSQVNSLHLTKEIEEGKKKPESDACVPNVQIYTDEWLNGRVKDNLGEIILSSVLVRNKALGTQQEKEKVPEKIPLPPINVEIPSKVVGVEGVNPSPPLIPHQDHSLNIQPFKRHVSASFLSSSNLTSLETPRSSCQSHKSISGKRDFDRQRTLHELKNWNAKDNQSDGSIFQTPPQTIYNNNNPQGAILKETLRNPLVKSSNREFDKIEIFNKSYQKPISFKSPLQLDVEQEQFNTRKRQRSLSISIVGKMNSELDLFIVNIEGNLAVFSPMNFLKDNPSLVRELPDLKRNGEMSDSENVLILLKEFISCNSQANLSFIKNSNLYFLKTLPSGLKNFAL